MTLGSILLLSVGVAMDAAAVAAARGLAAKVLLPRHAVIVAAFFGGFQALMPLGGWLLGSRFGSAVAAWDHWIAFVLLGGIGLKMLWEARGVDDAKRPPQSDLFGLKVMLVLGIATSVDAFAVGITLPMLDAPLGLTIASIGITTAALSVAGLYAGRRFGSALGPRLDALGGVVLLGLGVKVLVEHLTA